MNKFTMVVLKRLRNLVGMLLLAVALPLLWVQNSCASDEDFVKGSLGSFGSSFSYGGQSAVSADVGLPAEYAAVEGATRDAEKRAEGAANHADQQTCEEAEPYRTAARTQADIASVEAARIDSSMTIEEAKVVEKATNNAAAEATRNAHLAEQACGVVQSEDYSSPFDSLSNPVPSWNSTFWDISSP